MRAQVRIFFFQTVLAPVPPQTRQPSSLICSPVKQEMNPLILQFIRQVLHGQPENKIFMSFLSMWFQADLLPFFIFCYSVMPGPKGLI